jgi:hypothetical protein
MYADHDDDDNCQLTLADSPSNDDDDCLMDDSQSNIVIDYNSPFEDNTNFNDDDSPFLDDSIYDDDYSHEPNPTQYMQPHPNTHSGRIELSGSSQIPPSFQPSGIPPDIIAQLTPAELAHNPEFVRLRELFEFLQSTVSAVESSPVFQQRVQARERILEWRSGVRA